MMISLFPLDRASRRLRKRILHDHSYLQPDGLRVFLLFLVLLIAMLVIKIRNQPTNANSLQQLLTRMTIDNNSFGLTVSTVMNDISKESQLTTLSILKRAIDLYSLPVVVGQLWRIYQNDVRLLSTIMRDVLPTPDSKRIRTIGICYKRYYEGGVERVISLQIPLFLDMGYTVVLLTNSINTRREYALDERVIRVKLPTSYAHGRAEALHRGIREHKIDLFIHHIHDSDELLFDLLVCKLMRTPVIIERHGTILDSFLKNDKRTSLYHHVFQFADKVLTLSHMDEDYLQTMGVNVEYFPNPIQFPTVAKNYDANEGIIIWVGRLDTVDKNYLAAVQIMKELVRTHKKAKLVYVGPSYGPSAGLRLRYAILKNRLWNNVQWVGTTTDMASWYRKARIHLVTSSFESFSMTILESKSFGIPLVLYELPYLELLKSGKGYIAVPQYNSKAAAQALSLLLDNASLCNQLSAEAYQSVNLVRSFNQTSEWRRIIKEMENGAVTSRRKAASSKAGLRILFETLFFQYHSYQKLIARR